MKNVTPQKIIDLLDNQPEVFSGLSDHVLKQFRRWVPKTDHVLSAFEYYAVTVRRQDRRQTYGVKHIAEKLRWDDTIRQDDPAYKICNTLTAPIARCLMALNPELRNMFRIRMAA